MNRRELLQGLAAALGAAAIPIPPIEEFYTGSGLGMLSYLLRVKADVLCRLANPPLLMAENGTITKLGQEGLEDALEFINRMIRLVQSGELDLGPREVC